MHGTALTTFVHVESLSDKELESKLSDGRLLCQVAPLIVQLLLKQPEDLVDLCRFSLSSISSSQPETPSYPYTAQA